MKKIRQGREGKGKSYLTFPYRKRKQEGRKRYTKGTPSYNNTRKGKPKRGKGEGKGSLIRVQQTQKEENNHKVEVWGTQDIPTERIQNAEKKHENINHQQIPRHQKMIDIKEVIAKNKCIENITKKTAGINIIF